MVARAALVTGSAGLIGSECAHYLCTTGWNVHGVDNGMRRRLFGDLGDTTRGLQRLIDMKGKYTHHVGDVTDVTWLEDLFRTTRFQAVVHCAGQPSHDKSRESPGLDFQVNAVGTLNVLETARQFCLDAPIVFMSTNKVYGDNPNRVELVELATRYDFAAPDQREGISEKCSLDNCTHSVFGVSKASADLLCQEYGRSFGMQTTCLRLGCVTGPLHAGVQLHGFLSYLVRRCCRSREYEIIGYGGKQVRDQLHAVDLSCAVGHIIEKPQSGAVFNLGGGRTNSVSVLEALARVERSLGREILRRQNPTPRLGDHICYISDCSKFIAAYPKWRPSISLDTIFEQLIEAEVSATDGTYDGLRCL